MSPGGTDLERGYGDVRPWRPPFSRLSCRSEGPISSRRVSSQDPLLRKFWNFSLNSLNFHPNFSSQAPKFGKFSAHKPPCSEANVSSPAPHFGNQGRTPLPEKKLSAPPPRDMSRVPKVEVNVYKYGYSELSLISKTNSEEKHSLRHLYSRYLTRLQKVCVFKGSTLHQSWKDLV